MNILVCVKRVPDIGAKIELTPDRQSIVTKNLGFTISPHEECAVEEAVQLRASHGGEATVLALGPAAAEEQLRESLARGVDQAMLLETGGEEWDPGQTARALVQAIKDREQQAGPFDLLIFGNETGDSGDAQVGIRVAHGLGIPCLFGLKDLEISDGKVIGKREVDSGWEVFEAALPAVIMVKEGINLPHYPSLRGTMKAKKKKVDKLQPATSEAGLAIQALENPPEQKKEVQMLGEGPEAAPKVVEILKSLEVL